MNEAQVRVEPVRQEMHIPERNKIARLNRLMYMFGNVTARSRLEGRKGNPERPIGLRTDRTALVSRAHTERRQQNPGYREQLKAIFAEGRDRDEIARRYLQQGEVHVTFDDLGEQSSRYTRIVPPESRLLRGEDGQVVAQAPIFLIPGFENDVDCMGALAQEVAFNGREIIVVGQPDSHLGTTTPEFSAQIAADNGFESYTDYYKAVMKALIPEGDVELWGHSMGTAIAAEMLNDEEVRDRVIHAALLCPVGVINQPVNQIKLGLAKEAKRLFAQFSKLGKYTFASGRETDQTPEPESQRELKKGNMDHLFAKIAKRSWAFVGARVHEGGTITVLNGEKDFVTHSFEGADFVQKNPQVRVINLPNGHHNTPFTDAGNVAPMLLGR